MCEQFFVETVTKHVVVHVNSLSKKQTVLHDTIADTEMSSIIKFLANKDNEMYVYAGFYLAMRHGFKTMPLEVEVKSQTPIF